MAREISSCGKCVRISLVVINVLFGIIGLLLLVAAILCRASPTTILGVFATVPKAFSGVENYVIISLVTIGLLITIVSLIGLVGACARIRFLLFLYSIFLCCLVIFQVVIETYFYTNPTALQAGINQGVSNIMASYDDIDTPHVVLDSFFQQMECCGFNTPFSSDFHLKGGKKIPYSCCQQYRKFIDNPSPGLDSCVTSLAQSFKKGCFDVFSEKVAEKFAISISIVAIVFIIEIACCALSFVLCAEVHKLSKVRPMENAQEKAKKYNKEEAKNEEKNKAASKENSDSDWSVKDPEVEIENSPRKNCTF